jgi:uncharacterized membrane protein
MHTDHSARPSRAPSILLGASLGGFADGILLHQIAQWHNMGSAVLPPTSMAAMEQNMRWDGFFHLAMLVATVFGVYWLHADARSGKACPGPRVLSGLLILGWGVFNLLEGIIDHHLLELHHVRDVPTHVPAYDWIFLAVAGVGFILLGLALSRQRELTRA